jgi:hypothetical protein
MPLTSSRASNLFQRLAVIVLYHGVQDRDLWCRFSRLAISHTAKALIDRKYKGPTSPELYLQQSPSRTRLAGFK